MTETDIISSIRKFNRFYARTLGVFDKYALNTTYTLAQARIIGELGRNKGCTANSIALYLDMDRSYVARIINGFEKNDILIKKDSSEDFRKKHLFLTIKGISIYQELELRSDNKVKNQIQNLSSKSLADLQKSMNTILEILEKD